MLAAMSCQATSRNSIGDTASSTLVTKNDASAYLAEEIAEHQHFSASHQAIEVCHAFQTYLERRQQANEFKETVASLRDDVGGLYRLLHQWTRAFLAENFADNPSLSVDEVASVLFDNSGASRHVRAR